MLSVGSPESERAGLTPNLVIANRFQLARKLGEGGMGCVWSARHLTLGIDVAVKFIDTSLVKSDEARSRFAQEAMAAARIKSPHVVNILDYGTDDTGRPYIAMEILEGEDLSHRLAREGTLSVAETARVITQACRGLSKAHAAGIVHRDLKPENLFLCDDEDGFLLKILDFGIAKAQIASGISHKTALGAIVGTPAYMSPEQAQGEGKIDHRSDLYSLATVAYHALAGSPPFPDDNLHALLVGLIARPAPPVSLRQPHLSAKFDAWFAKALAKKPSMRFETARELAESFVGLCSSAGPPVEDWSFTGSELRVVPQPMIPDPDSGDRALGLVATLRREEAGARRDAPPVESMAEEVEDDETVVEPQPQLFRIAAAACRDDDDEDDGETEVGGFFDASPAEDRLVIVGVGAVGQPGADESSSSISGSSAGAAEVEIEWVAEADDSPKHAAPVDSPGRWVWLIALLFIIALTAGTTALLATWLSG